MKICYNYCDECDVQDVLTVTFKISWGESFALCRNCLENASKLMVKSMLKGIKNISQQ